MSALNHDDTAEVLRARILRERHESVSACCQLLLHRGRDAGIDEGFPALTVYPRMIDSGVGRHPMHCRIHDAVQHRALADKVVMRS